MVVSVPGPDDAVGAAALPTPELDGVASAAGHWRLDTNTDGQTAAFVDRAGVAQFAIRCDRAARRIIFVRASGGGISGMVKIITGSGAASYVAKGRRFAPGVLASVPINDSFITTSLAEARGRIGVVMAGTPTLAMVADHSIGAVINSCSANR